MAIYRRARSPFWWYSFVHRGRRIYRSTGVTDHRQAQQIYFIRRNEYILGKERGELPPFKLRDLLQKYLDKYSKINKRSYPHDCGIVKMLNSFFGEKVLSDVTPQLIEEYKAHRRMMLVGQRQVSGARVNRDLAILKAAFNKGIEWGLAKENPVKKVKFFHEKDRARLRYLSQVEKTRLLAACPPALKRIVVMALKTGMRRGEILNLKWTDIDLESGQIVIRRSKSGKPRFIPLHPDVLEVLEALPKKGDYVFGEIRAGGGPYTGPGWLRFNFQAALEKAGIRDFRFHDLRHTFASELVMKGADLKTVSELLGHSSVVMTERYAHLAPSHKAMAVNLLSSESGTSREASGQYLGVKEGSKWGRGRYTIVTLPKTRITGIEINH